MSPHTCCTGSSNPAPLRKPILISCPFTRNECLMLPDHAIDSDPVRSRLRAAHVIANVTAQYDQGPYRTARASGFEPARGSAVSRAPGDPAGGQAQSQK